MLDILLKLIFEVEIQDLIADVDALERKFDNTLEQIKKLPREQQVDIISKAQIVLRDRYNLSNESLKDIADLKGLFSHLTYKHKLARAKDAGEKIVHAMHKVLLLQTPQEFEAMSFKYANNHDKHIQDAESYFDGKPEGIEGVKRAFVEGLEIDKIIKMLESSHESANTEVAEYKRARDHLRDLTGKEPQHDESTTMVATIKDLNTAIDNLKGAANRENLQASFAALVELRIAKLSAKLATDATPKLEFAVKKVEQDQRDIIAETNRIVDAFKKFTEETDIAVGDPNTGKGFIGKLDSEGYIPLDAAIKSLNNVREDLRPKIAIEVNNQITGIKISPEENSKPISIKDSLGATAIALKCAKA